MQNSINDRINVLQAMFAAIFIILGACVILGGVIAFLGTNNTDFLKSQERREAEAAMIEVKVAERQEQRPFLVWGAGLFAIIAGGGGGVGAAIFFVRAAFYLPPAICYAIERRAEAIAAPAARDAGMIESVTKRQLLEDRNAS
jgi:hypothetical protein